MLNTDTPLWVCSHVMSLCMLFLICLLY